MAPNLDENILRQQRIFLYSQLYIRLPATNFILVLPLQQIALIFQAGLKLTKERGWCHGLGELWCKLLLEDQSKFQVVWLNLLNDQSYNFNFFEKTEPIRQDQLKQTCHYALHKNKHANAKYCAHSAGLINYIYQHLSNNSCLKQVMIFNLGHTNFNPRFPLYRLLPKTWHQLRFYIDRCNQLHFFDANCGWFKSRAEYSKNDLLNFIGTIFAMMQYDKKYNLIVLSNRFLLKEATKLSTGACPIVKERINFRTLTILSP